MAVVLLEVHNLRHDVDRAAYDALTERMCDLMRTMPGFVSVENYDDEGVAMSVVTFGSAAALAAWRDLPEHVAAQQLGRERLYIWSSVRVCEVTLERKFPPRRHEDDPHGSWLSFPFPPAELGAWRRLDREGRRRWLDCAHARCFDAQHSGFVRTREPDRRVVLDGALVEDLISFYCAIGEAVNGPGGYFGRRMMGFDDCLCSGFGLDFPYTIVWERSALSRDALGAPALLDYLDRECTPPTDDDGQRWIDERRAAALRGERTMFDEIVETVRSRGGEDALVLA